MDGSNLRTVLCSCGHPRYIYSVAEQQPEQGDPPLEETLADIVEFFESEGLCRDCEKRGEPQTKAPIERLYVVFDTDGTVAGHINSRTPRVTGPDLGRQYQCIPVTECSSRDVEDGLRRRDFQKKR